MALFTQAMHVKVCRRRRGQREGRGGGAVLEEVVEGEEDEAVLWGTSGENLQSVSPGNLSPTSTASQIRGGKVKDTTLEPPLPPLSFKGCFRNGF